MGAIRVGIIGLSPAQSFSGPGSWAASAHLPALLELPEYEIVALANSSIESAKRSIAAHNLPPSTKAYGSPEDIASDPEVDLVVVCVQVGKHYQLCKPALLHKKKVFVEWPLAATMDEVEELMQLASDANVDTAVGLQSRAAPAIQKVKEIITSGKLGRILSSTVVVSTSKLITETWPENMTYFLDASSGGNQYTIGFGHFLDTFTDVLCELSDVQAILKTQYKTARLLDPEGQALNEKINKTAPDHIFLQGTFGDGAVASVAFRNPKYPADDTGFRWIISGTEGEISISGDEWWPVMHDELQLRLKIGVEPTRTISYDSYKVSVADKLPPVAANVVSLYSAFAKGETTKYATFASAAQTHRILEKIRKAANVQ